ncbi:MAG: SCO family protein [Acidobacteriota bacterium]
MRPTTETILPTRPGRGRARPLHIGLVVLLAFAAPLVAQHEGDGADGGHGDHSEHMARAAAAGGEPEQLSGLKVPDVEVVTQDGEKVHFYSDLVEDRVVAMNFVFTTCTTVCPPMGAIFGRLEQRLGERAGRDVHLISVSVDPSTDTPERLRDWAAKFGRTPGWTLVTGDKTTVNSLLKSLQVFTPDFEDHAPTVLLGNDTRGEWTRAYGLASPDRLAELLDGLAAPDAAAEGR